jgi:hypothetical protein
MDVLSTGSVVSIDLNAIPVARVILTKYRRLGWFGKRTYDVSLDMAALRLIEQRIGKDLTVVKNWFDLKPADLAVILCVGLHRRTITLEQVEKWLAPALFDDLWCMLFDLCHPKVREMLKQVQQKLKEGTPDPTAAEPQSKSS